ncbi:MAG: hypothetical protein C0600_16390 [Ignavibacteria bacterium]|nr:MAG: hypothetical protein C0600_16390 [Ignavibacteria bacterium]
MNDGGIGRRDFLKASGAAAVIGAMHFSLPEGLQAMQQKKSRVVLIRDEQVLDKLNKPKTSVLTRMFDEAVTKLCDAQNAEAAWQHMIKPSDRVGIKTNVWRYLRTPRALEQHAARHMMELGVPEEHIAVDDRGVLDNEGFDNVTALINMRPMRTHHWSGLGTLIKNYIMFIPRPAELHGDSCADLASVWKLPHVVGRTRLNVLVMLTPLFHGSGPHHYDPKYIWRYNGLLVGFDPVAVDAVGARIIEAKRRAYFGEERPINPPPKHIQLADTRHGLGHADPSRIDLIRLGWKDGELI